MLYPKLRVSLTASTQFSATHNGSYIYIIFNRTHMDIMNWLVRLESCCHSQMNAYLKITIIDGNIPRIYNYLDWSYNQFFFSFYRLN